MERRLSSAAEPANSDKKTSIMHAKQAQPRAIMARRLVQRINRQTAEELGIEISGLLRHHLAREGDVAHLFCAYRVHQECDIGVTGAHTAKGLAGSAYIAEVLLVTD